MSGLTAVYFIVCGIVALAGALGTVLSKSPLRAALSLLANIIALAGMYLGLNAELLAVIQLLVYAGAIVVLFIFVIMLIGPSATTSQDSRGLLTRTFGLVMMALLASGLAFTLGVYDVPMMPMAFPRCPPGAVDCAPFGGIEAFGRELYRDGLLPFELISITLLVAIVGAVAIARGRTVAELDAIKKKQAEVEAEAARKLERDREISAEVAAHGGHG